MRKIFSVLLSVILILSAAGCAPRNTNPSQPEPILERSSSESVDGGELTLADEKIVLDESLALTEPSESQPASSASTDETSTDSQESAAEPSLGAAGESKPELESSPESQPEPEPASSEILAEDTPASSSEPETTEITEVLGSKPVYNNVRAVWFSYLTLEPLAKNKSKAEFTANIDQAFANVADMGFNTVFMHVRPFGDALYDSSYYPWSYLLSGTEGKKPGYDPLEIMCQLADRHGLRIEAWLNPYRVRASGGRELSSDNQAKKWLDSGNDGALEWNGGVYYNPGSEAARKLIINGVKEIVKNYNVDGIHFDDYFYPTTDMSFDQKTYQASGSSKSQADWRRENVNILVRQVYSAIKSIDASCVFGISPQGNTKNNYDVQFIDCAKWLANKGYIDYICPQVYFGFENSGHPFAETVDTWNRMIKVSSIDLYIGIAAYKLGQTDDWAGTGKNEWIGTTDILSRMVQTARGASHYGGVAFYSYDSLYLSNTAQVRSEKTNLKKLF